MHRDKALSACRPGAQHDRQRSETGCAHARPHRSRVLLCLILCLGQNEVERVWGVVRRHPRRDATEPLPVLAVLVLLAWPAMAAATPTALVAAGPLSFAPLTREVAGDGQHRDHRKRDPVDLPPSLRGMPSEKQCNDRMRAGREPVLGAASGFILRRRAPGPG